MIPGYLPAIPVEVLHSFWPLRLIMYYQVYSMTGGREFAIATLLSFCLLFIWTIIPIYFPRDKIQE